MMNTINKKLDTPLKPDVLQDAFDKTIQEIIEKR
jgi:hypothetical protein